MVLRDPFIRNLSAALIPDFALDHIVADVLSPPLLRYGVFAFIDLISKAYFGAGGRSAR